MKPLLLAFLGSLTWHVVFLFWLPVSLWSLPEVKTSSPQVTFVGRVVESKEKAVEISNPKFKFTIWEKIFQAPKAYLKFPESAMLPLNLKLIWEQIPLEIREVNIQPSSGENFVFLNSSFPKFSSVKIYVTPVYIHPLQVEMGKLVGDLNGDFKNWLRAKKVNIYVPQPLTIKF